MNWGNLNPYNIQDIKNIISEIFDVSTDRISNLSILKAGMTNRSFRFEINDEAFIMRVPGEGTSELISRQNEYDVYQVIKDENICDDLRYINSVNGYKITKFINDARNCDPYNIEDVQKCMSFLRNFHQKELKVSHTFDMFEQIDFYESLRKGLPSIYKDYKDTKNNVIKLKSYIDAQNPKFVLTHIDAVPDNFLFTKEGIRLIDWEYAGMQDPHLDIAMFGIYSMYDKKQMDDLINIYFTEGCPHNIRLKIYCYVAVAGLLWSNWCEYKHILGVDFGEYSLNQYNYAKDYYRYFSEEVQQ